MSLTLASPLSVLPSQISGEIYINVPIKCVGPAVTATIKLYIFEGSILATHGTLLAEYSQQVEFLGGQIKDVLFTHTETATRILDIIKQRQLTTYGDDGISRLYKSWIEV